MSLIEDLKVAIAVFVEIDERVLVRGEWAELLSDLHVTSFMDQPRRGELVDVHRSLRLAQDDLFNITTLLLRLEWQRTLTGDGELDRFRAANFAQADINSFHVEMRSFFDHVAHGIAASAGKKGQLPSDSFRALRKYATKNPERTIALLGKTLADSVTQCEWFVDLRDVRDDLVHRGGSILVFPHEDRLLFQCYVGFAQRVRMPAIMFNENVADFELYAGLLLGQTLALLERVAVGIRDRLGIPASRGGATMIHEGNAAVLGAIAVSRRSSRRPRCNASRKPHSARYRSGPGAFHGRSASIS